MKTAERMSIHSLRDRPRLALRLIAPLESRLRAWSQAMSFFRPVKMKFMSSISALLKPPRSTVSRWTDAGCSKSAMNWKWGPSRSVSAKWPRLMRILLVRRRAPLRWPTVSSGDDRSGWRGYRKILEEVAPFISPEEAEAAENQLSTGYRMLLRCIASIMALYGLSWYFEARQWFVAQEVASCVAAYVELLSILVLTARYRIRFAGTLGLAATESMSRTRSGSTPSTPRPDTP